VAELTGVNFFEGEIRSDLSNGLAEVWVGDTRISAAADHQVAGDTLLTFFPSDVTLTVEAPADQDPNVFRTRVRDMVHMGDKVRVSLNGSLAMNAEITATTLDRLGIAEGQAVFASVPPEAVRTYR
jgi:ABC-type molybdate transport system ATPase subunit